MEVGDFFLEGKCHRYMSGASTQMVRFVDGVLEFVARPDRRAGKKIPGGYKNFVPGEVGTLFSIEGKDPRRAVF